MLMAMEQPPALAATVRRRGEQGSSLVEFALIVTLLSTLLLGIVVFGILLSKRQVLTQAAAEGARIAVPYQYTVPNTTNVKDAAKAQVNKSLVAMDRFCGDAGTVCAFDVYPCSGTLADAPTGSGDCLRVNVVLTVFGSKPLAPNVGFINPFLPSTMSSTFTTNLANPS